MIGIVVWKAVVAWCVLGLILAVVGYLMVQVRRTHTFKVGGRTYWDILRGRYPRVPRKPRR